MILFSSVLFLSPVLVYSVHTIGGSQGSMTSFSTAQCILLVVVRAIFRVSVHIIGVPLYIYQGLHYFNERTS